MNQYGLTEEEKKTHLQQYNHALFKNSMAFMNIVWEINVLMDTVVILADKENPGKERIEFCYHDFYDDYVMNRVMDSDVEVFETNMSLSNLKKLRDEAGFYAHLLSPDGDWHLHRIVLTPAAEEDDDPYCIYFAAINLHEEEQRELAHYRTAEMFREALISNSYFHFEIDVTDGGMIEKDYGAKDGSYPITDSTKMELPIPYKCWVDKWYELYEPEFDTQQVENIFDVEYFKRAYARNERIMDVEVKQKKQDGSGRIEFMHIFVVLIEDITNKHIKACIIWRDISAFRGKILEDKLKLQSTNEDLRRTVTREEQFRRAALSGAIMVYNINLTRNLIEDEFYEIVDGTSYPMLELVGLSAPCSFDEFRERWSEQKIPVESRESFLEVYNREYLLDSYSRGEYQLEMEFDTTIGRGIPITLRSTALLVRDGASGDILAMVNGRDVSSQREEEYKKRETLRMALDSANSANAAKSSFLARMSHDIRTPMNAIIGMTAIARTRLDDPERVRDCLDKITASSDHLLRLINEVLDMSKIESGMIGIKEEEFALPELLDDMLVMSRPLINAKHHELTVTIHGVVHEKVIGDQQHIQQAFMNFMSNAVKYTPDGGQIHLIITEKPTGNPRVGCYEVVFKDNGIGMSEEFQARIFEPFERAEDERAIKEQGTGLGMAITKNIVEMMNGNIKVESRLNEGTTFTVTIFLKLQETTDERKPEDLSVNVSQEEMGDFFQRAMGHGNDEKEAPASLDGLMEEDFGGHRVLLVEDYELNAEIAQEILEMAGLTVEWARDGKEALDCMVKADDWYYDLVFMDIQMPVMNGYESARAIRAIGRDYTSRVPILAMTANAFAEDVQEALAAGMNEHIAKPIDFDILKRVLKTWIRGGRG